MARIRRAGFACQRGSLTIRGTEYRPEGDDLPIAIVSHGFMANQGTVRQYAKALAEMGYAAYCFDFCGGCVLGGKSDGATTDMSVLTEVTDLEAVMAHARSLPYTHDEGLTLMGCSQGGFVSALTAAKHPAEVARLILFYPALCIPDDARKGQMMWARFDPQNLPEIISCGPMKLGRCYPADVLNLQPPVELIPYPGDVLIVHGDRDEIVPAAYSETAAMAYQLARFDHKGENRVQLEIIPGAGHGFSGKADRLAMGFVRNFLASPHTARAASKTTDKGSGSLHP